MPNKENLVENMDIYADPNTETDIDKIIEGYKEKEPDLIPKGYKEYNVDFENDPDMALLLEFADELVGTDGLLLEEKKVIKNWRYFSKPQDNFKFYKQKAKYILTTYETHTKYFEDYKHKRTTREMSNEMFYEVLGNCRFFEQCLGRELIPYIFVIQHIFFNRTPIREMEKIVDLGKGAIEYQTNMSVKTFAKLLVARDKYRFYGKKIFDKAVDKTAEFEKLVLYEKIEIVGQLAMTLINKIKELDKKDKKKNN